MDHKNPGKPLKETTKDDSLDIGKVKHHKPSPPPQPKASSGSKRSQEDEEAQKGHS